jgi:hypothetical protein
MRIWFNGRALHVCMAPCPGGAPALEGAPERKARGQPTSLGALPVGKLPPHPWERRLVPSGAARRATRCGQPVRPCPTQGQTLPTHTQVERMRQQYIPPMQVGTRWQSEGWVRGCRFTGGGQRRWKLSARWGAQPCPNPHWPNGPRTGDWRWGMLESSSFRRGRDVGWYCSYGPERKREAGAWGST